VFIGFRAMDLPPGGRPVHCLHGPHAGVNSEHELRCPRAAFDGCPLVAGSREPRQRHEADRRVTWSLAAKVGLLAPRRNPGVGHQGSFATHSKTRPRHAGEGQLPGDESEGRLGSTRPLPDARHRPLSGLGSKRSLAATSRRSPKVRLSELAVLARSRQGASATIARGDALRGRCFGSLARIHGRWGGSA
jgi:hypothetical protein